MLRILFDEDLDARIVRGLRRRVPELDSVTMGETELRGIDDDQVLELGELEERLLVSHDVNTMTAAFRRRVGRGKGTAGLLLVPQSLPIGRAIVDLELIALATSAEDWRGRLEFIPL